MGRAINFFGILVMIGTGANQAQPDAALRNMEKRLNILIVG